MLFVSNLTSNSFTSQNSNGMLCLDNVLLRNVLIHNLEVSLNVHLTFLQLAAGKLFRNMEWLQ